MSKRATQRYVVFVPPYDKKEAIRQSMIATRHVAMEDLYAWLSEFMDSRPEGAMPDDAICEVRNFVSKWLDDTSHLV